MKQNKFMYMTGYKNSNYDMEYDLKFLDQLTLIGGESGTGKTLFYNLMLKKAANDTENIYCFNASTNQSVINNALKMLQYKLIIVDNADISLDDKARYLVATNTKNQIILLGRNSNGLHLTPTRYAELIEDNNRVYLEYSFLV